MKRFISMLSVLTVVAAMFFVTSSVVSAEQQMIKRPQGQIAPHVLTAPQPDKVLRVSIDKIETSDNPANPNSTATISYTIQNATDEDAAVMKIHGFGSHSFPDSGQHVSKHSSYHGKLSLGPPLQDGNNSVVLTIDVKVAGGFCMDKITHQRIECPSRQIKSNPVSFNVRRCQVFS